MSTLNRQIDFIRRYFVALATRSLVATSSVLRRSTRIFYLAAGVHLLSTMGLLSILKKVSAQ